VTLLCINLPFSTWTAHWSIPSPTWAAQPTACWNSVDCPPIPWMRTIALWGTASTSSASAACRQTHRRFFAAFNEDYSRHCLDKTAPYAGIPEVLEQLRSAGVHIAVASNKTQPFVEKIVKHYFGENGFDQILGSSDSRPKKPSPEIISVILENAGMTPEQAVMIGDSNVDIRTAKNAGVHSIGCTWGFRGRDELAEAGADDLAEKPEDLLKFTLM
jgi:HAD superfamily hydrolase (TIGR01662 family)